ncbi:MAG: iron-containing redox enzyme family protein [Bdellovibrionota bacterium]
MTPYQMLQQATAADLERFCAVPFARRFFEGHSVPLECYEDFLRQAYHRVKHTVPLLAATLANHPEEPVRSALRHYINEEFGHQEWVLSDLRSLGVDVNVVRAEKPYPTVDALIHAMYWSIYKVNPWCMFGMIYVLEDMSVRIAHKMVAAIKRDYDLTAKSFVYLSTHGDVDVDHTEFLQNTIDSNLRNDSDLADVIQTAKTVYRTWGEVWRDHSEKYKL